MNNSALDIIAGIAFGAFLVTVVVKGKTPGLIYLAKRDKAFLQWAIALSILLYLYSLPELKGPVSLIIFMALLGLGIHSGDEIVKQAKIFWESLEK